MGKTPTSSKGSNGRRLKKIGKEAKKQTENPLLEGIIEEIKRLEALVVKLKREKKRTLANQIREKIAELWSNVLKNNKKPVSSSLTRVHFSLDAKNYDGSDKNVEKFMLDVYNFLEQHPTQEQIETFVVQFELTDGVLHALSLLVERMKCEVASWGELIKEEGSKLLTVENFNQVYFARVDNYIRTKVKMPRLFLAGRRQGANPIVRVSARRLGILRTVEELVKERLASER
jgi:hypothetical protein